MKNRINEKIEEIEEFILTLDSFLPSDFDEYLKDEKTKAACEHYFEKIIEAAVDLSYLVINEKKFRTPKDDADTFSVLVENKIISVELSEKLRDAKGMRNIIAHEYGKIDDALVFHAITEELINDISEFLSEIKKRIK